MDSHNFESPQMLATNPIAQPPDIAEGRRELARLIGRLLAHHWLQEQRTSPHRPGRENAANNQTMPLG